MALDYQISVDLNTLRGLTAEVAQAIAPNVQFAVSATAAEAVQRWQQAVMQAKLWHVEKDAYLKSIRWEMTSQSVTANGLDYVAKVWTDYRLAPLIETGRPARDMKAVLPTAKRARQVKNGKHAGQLYLIVPFRHNVPSAAGIGAHAPQMPAHIYAQAKALAASTELPLGSKKPATRLSATGHTVPQKSYAWGGRLPAGLAPKKKAYHVTDLYAGMVRFDTSSGKQKSSAYMTFRTMGQWSDGWIVPAKPGQYLAKGVMDSIQPTFDAIIRQAVRLGG
jgi:hypothetical protein